MKKTIAALICALAASVGASYCLAADVGPTVVAQPGVSERMAKAREAIKNKDWQKALVELNAAAKSEPRNPDVHTLLGFSYRKQATPDLPKAFEHYKTALSLNPKHKGALEYIGEAYLMDKKPTEAEKYLAELEKVCGNKTCEEYADLSKAIADYKAKS